MPAKSLQELFVEELRDAYDGEKRLTKALPKMAKAAESDELRAAFTNHLRETERQIQRLEQVFRTVGEPVRGKKCDGLMGIIEEGKSAMEELEGSVLDAALIAGAQRAEHYEIAAYGTLAYFAELLGNQRAKDLLGQTLDEEKAADETLTTIAKSSVNRNALIGAGTEDEEESSMPRAARRGARRMVASGRGSRGSGTRAVAHDRSRGGVRGNAGGRRRSS
jgi:ferritin-like metal-binding protein YciE